MTSKRHTLLHQNHRTTTEHGRNVKAIPPYDLGLRVATARLTPQEKVWLGVRVRFETVTACTRAPYETCDQPHRINRVGTVWALGRYGSTLWVVFDGSDHPVEISVHALNTVTEAVAD